MYSFDIGPFSYKFKWNQIKSNEPIIAKSK